MAPKLQSSKLLSIFGNVLIFKETVQTRTIYSILIFSTGYLTACHIHGEAEDIAINEKVMTDI